MNNLLKRMCVKKNNDGFTLVELIITLAVFAIVMVQVSTIMYNCSHLYIKGVDNIDLQSEAQRVIQYTEELMVDVPTDGEISSTVDTKYIDGRSEIITINSVEATEADPTVFVPVEYTISLDKKAKSVGVFEDYGELKLTKTKNGSVVTKDEVIADYVSSISLNMANYATDDKVTVNVCMKSDDYQYDSVAIKDIYLRNHPGTKKLEDDGGSNDGTYRLEVLRYKTYDLASLFAKGGSYTYEITEGSEYYSLTGSKVQCVDSVNNNTKYPSNGGKVIAKDADDKEVFSVALDTKKLRIGMGEEGSNVGSVVCYGNAKNSSTVTSFADVQGIYLGTDDVDSITCKFSSCNVSSFNYTLNEGSEQYIQYFDGETKVEYKFKYKYDDATNSFQLIVPGDFKLSQGSYKYPAYMNSNNVEAMKASIYVTFKNPTYHVTFNVFFAPLVTDDYGHMSSNFWDNVKDYKTDNFGK